MSSSILPNSAPCPFPPLPVTQTASPYPMRSCGGLPVGRPHPLSSNPFTALYPQWHSAICQSYHITFLIKNLQIKNFLSIDYKDQQHCFPCVPILMVHPGPPSPPCSRHADCVPSPLQSRIIALCALLFRPQLSHHLQNVQCHYIQSLSAPMCNSCQSCYFILMS